MIFVAVAVLAILALTPLAWTLRRQGRLRSRRDAAVALHRAQLVELERDQADGRIAPEEYATAVLEVQRRLLAAAAERDAPEAGSPRSPLVFALVLVPLAALGLYLPGAKPFMPAEPLASRVATAERQQQEEAALMATLRARVTALDPNSERARQGFILLGTVEDSQGDLPAAIADWTKALAARFDPMLAAQTAETMTRMVGHVTPEAESLFRRALAEAPADAPWRGVAEQRIAEATGAGAGAGSNGGANGGLGGASGATPPPAPR